MKRFHGKYLIVVEIFIFLIVIASQDISVEKKKILLESPMRLLSGLSLLRIPTLSFPLGLLDRYFFQVKKKKKVKK